MNLTIPILEILLEKDFSLRVTVIVVHHMTDLQVSMEVEMF